MGKRRGRKKGSRNPTRVVGVPRGWFVLDNGKKTSLCYEDGERIRDKDESSKVLDEAYHRWRQSQKEQLARAKEDAPNPITVREVVNAYLTYAKRHAAPKTYKDRCETLFDFVTGLPPRFRKERSRKEQREAQRIHPGYGDVVVCELTPLHIDKWIAAYDNWTKGGDLPPFFVPGVMRVRVK